MNNDIYSKNINVEQRQNLSNIEIKLRKNDLLAYNDISTKLDTTKDVELSKSLKNLGLKFIPDEKYEVIMPDEYEVCRFAESVLTSKTFSLDEKKSFMNSMHMANSELSVASVALFNTNQMNQLDDTCKKADHFELLSHFTYLSDLGNPEEESFMNAIRKKAPIVSHKSNNAILLAKVISDNVPSHRKEVAEFGGDVEALKAHKIEQLRLKIEKKMRKAHTAKITRKLRESYAIAR